MATRVISITIVVVFLLGIALGSFWAIWSSTRSENQPLDLTKPDQQGLIDTDTDTLDDFEPLSEPLVELTFEDLVVGEGAEAKIDDNLTVVYLGALASSGEVVEVGDYESFGLSFENELLLEGWVEGLVGMKVGGVRRLLIPANLAYGSLGSPDLSIPVDADMVYDFELIGIADGGVQSTTMIDNFTPTSDRLEDLVIEDTVEGSGDRQVRAGDTVTVHYTGALMIDGTVFDSSSGGQPITFSLSRVIAGWQEGLVGMKIGGQRRLFIPAQKGYGDGGSGDSIPPDSDLVFDVELVDIVTDDEPEGELNE